MGMVLPEQPGLPRPRTGKVLGDPTPATRLDPLRLQAPPPAKPAELDPPAHVTVVPPPTSHHHTRLTPGSTDSTVKHTAATPDPLTSRKQSDGHHQPPRSRPVRPYPGSAQPPPRHRRRGRVVVARRGCGAAAAAHRVRGHRDGAVVLRGPAGAAAGGRAREVRHAGGRRGRHRHRRAARPSAATSSTATAGRSPTPSTAGWWSPTRCRPGPRRTELARFLATQLHIDYFTTLAGSGASTDSRFAYVARRVPATLGRQRRERRPRQAGFKGLDTRNDPVRDYPDHDVAANLVGFMGTDEPLAGLELTFNKQLAGTDGSETYEVGGGNRIPLGHSTVTPAHNGTDLHTTIDDDLQWYTQRVLRQTVRGARADSGFAVVMDTRTGELLSLADYPTYDATQPDGLARQGPQLAGDDEPLRARLGREGAHPQRA